MAQYHRVQGRKEDFLMERQPDISRMRRTSHKRASQDRVSEHEQFEEVSTWAVLRPGTPEPQWEC